MLERVNMGRKGWVSLALPGLVSNGEGHVHALSNQLAPSGRRRGHSSPLLVQEAIGGRVNGGANSPLNT